MISKTLHHLKTLTNLAGISWRERSHYGSTLQLPTIMRLRIAATPTCRSWFSKRLVALNVAGDDHPVYVRQSTSDFPVFRDIFEGGEYDPIRKWSLPDAPVILDLGANIGMATRYFTRLWRNATVIALEPDATNQSLYERNCAHLLASSRAHLKRAFISEREGFASIDRTGESWEFKKTDARVDGKDQIPCLTVPGLIREFGLRQIDVLKCDIEGSESELFRDCASWIGLVKHLVIETHPPYSLEAFYADLRRGGLSFDVTDEDRREPYPLSFLQSR